MTTSKYLSVSITTEQELIVTVIMPNQGEFGVTILHRTVTHTDVQMTPVCNYLLSTLTYTSRIIKARDVKVIIRTTNSSLV